MTETSSSDDQTGSTDGTRDESGPPRTLTSEMPRHLRLRGVRELLAESVGDSSFDWITQLVTIATTSSLTLLELRSLCADLAWLSRQAGESLPDVNTATPDAIVGNTETYSLVRAYVIGQRLRFDFRFETLHDLTQLWLSEFEEDGLIVAFAAFAALGMRLPQGLAIYRQAIASPNADTRSRHVCLSGIWLAHHVPDQPTVLLELSDLMLGRGEVDSNVFFRRASALRRLGKHDEAIEEIDHAILLLEPGNNAVHQDYTREREFILAMADMRTYAESLTAEIGQDVLSMTEKRIKEAATALTNQVEAAQKVVSDALLKIVEILGLFVTLVGFLVGSGAVALKATSFGEGALAMTLVIIGALCFFVLLRVVTSLRRRR